MLRLDGRLSRAGDTYVDAGADIDPHSLIARHSVDQSNLPPHEPAESFLRGA